VSIRRAAAIVGVYEHPGRRLPDHSLAQIHAECAVGAVRDAGLSLDDVDAYFCGGDAPGFGGISMAEYLGLRLRWVDSTEAGGSSYLSHVGHAAAAIAAGKCSVALITLGGRPYSSRIARPLDLEAPELAFEQPYGMTAAPAAYALAAQRHMYEYGTTSRQLAEVRVTASRHAQHNPHAVHQEVVTADEVIDSPLIADPLHRLDCCVVTDGGGAIVMTSPSVARSLPRRRVQVLGHGEAPKHANNGRIDLTYSGARWSGPAAFREAGISLADVDYAGLYDSFTFTVIQQIEDLGFCEAGEGGKFVLDGALEAPHGRLPFNTDGGGLCNNHPANRGGITKIIEAVRQLRGEAHPALQVPDCEIALVQGTGGYLGTRMGSATLVLGREDA
jgi:acetyl-CoA C-acetyltransferase